MSTEGAHYLAQALANNKVRHILFYFTAYHHHILIQTLTVLNLGSNGIYAKGAEYLAQALEKNTVKYIIFCFIKY